jgi:nicotinamidase-related amidase
VLPESRAVPQGGIAAGGRQQAGQQAGCPAAKSWFMLCSSNGEDASMSKPVSLWQRLAQAKTSKTWAGVLPALAAAMAIFVAAPVAAQTIVDEWGTVKAPPAPELKPATADNKTALLLLDFGKQNCGARPRCLTSVPKVQKMANEARSKGIFVVHSLFGQATKADLLIAPLDNEPIVKSGANKFYRTDLEKILKDKGITTVIVTGTAAHGAVLNTAAAAALMGFKVILPVDAMSADPYAEQYTAWHLANAPGGIGPNVTLTKIDMIKF